MANKEPHTTQQQKRRREGSGSNENIRQAHTKNPPSNRRRIHQAKGPSFLEDAAAEVVEFEMAAVDDTICPSSSTTTTEDMLLLFIKGPVTVAATLSAEITGVLQGN